MTYFHMHDGLFDILFMDKEDSRSPKHGSQTLSFTRNVTRGTYWLRTLKIHSLKSNLNGWNTDGSFTMANSNSFWSPYEILIAAENKYLGIISYFIMKLYVVCIHYNRLDEAILMSTLNIPLLYRISKKNSLNYRHFLPVQAP